ncbi:MAG: hypothetical protein RIB58_12530 [Phycisphaerales bacterium]|jgi:hypothetical protein
MNRLTRERAITAGALVGVTAASGLAVWWALQPAPPLAMDRAQELTPDEGTRLAAQPLDASAFDVVLWSEPEELTPAEAATVAAATPEPPPPPPAQINLSLIAIVEADTGWQVALYDPGEQRIVLAGAGDAVGTVRVREVTESTVLLELAGRTRQLALQGGAP